MVRLSNSTPKCLPKRNKSFIKRPAHQCREDATVWMWNVPSPAEGHVVRPGLPVVLPGAVEAASGQAIIRALWSLGMCPGRGPLDPDLFLFP